MSTHEDDSAFQSLMFKYTVVRRRVRYLKLRSCAKLTTDKDGGKLVEFTDLIDAIWDAHERMKQK